MARPQIQDTRVEKPNPWFDLITKTVHLPHAQQPQQFYTVKPPDYVVVLAQTTQGQVVLVRQYRPAAEGYLLELPAGTVDGGEDPELATQRELQEETGYVAHELVPLGPLLTDHGRLENRLWAYYAPRVSKPSGDWQPEPGIEVALMGAEPLLAMIREGRFTPSMHIAVVGLAVLRGLLVV